jgi:lysophospholipase L1-like esterase
LIGVVGGCGWSDASTGAFPIPSPVFILETDLLEPPAIVKPGVFKPSALFDLDPGDPSAGQYACFYVVTASRRTEDVQFRWRDTETGYSTRLELGAPHTADFDGLTACDLESLSVEARAWLAAPGGVYRRIGPGGAEEGGQARFAVLVHEQMLTPFTSLEVSTGSTSGGTAIRAARLDIVRGYFYVAILGDSVLWGTGLPERDKMTTLVAATIERETKRRVVRQRYAQTGARIVPAVGDSSCAATCSGEVPRVSTSITTQADLIQRPELLDLVILDGCINDVGVIRIIDPRVSREELADRIRSYCGGEMATLLLKVRTLAPQAPIVVTGYFQIVSDDGDPFRLRQWAATHDLALNGEDQELVNAIAASSVLFRDLAHEQLRAAVDSINAQIGGPPRVGFVDPGFGAVNAAFGADPWLWSTTSQTDWLGGLEVEIDLFPEDPLQSFRMAKCFEPQVIGDFLSCIFASVGHPNRTGARVYAEAITQTLRDLGVLPAVPGGA